MKVPTLCVSYGPTENSPKFGCPPSRHPKHPIAGETMMFSPKGKRGSGSECFGQRKMVSQDIVIKINFWPKAISIPRNSPKILIQGRYFFKMFFFIYITKKCFLQHVMYREANNTKRLFQRN